MKHTYIGDLVTNVNLAKAIKTTRQKRKMSQTNLAVSCDLSQGLISSIEKGVKYPSTQTLEKISKGLGLPLSMMLLYGVDLEEVKAGGNEAEILFYETTLKLVEMSIDCLNYKTLQTNLNDKAQELESKLESAVDQLRSVKKSTSSIYSLEKKASFKIKEAFSSQ